MNDKIFLSFGPFTITWYALFILTGVVVAYELSQRTMKKWKYSSSVLEDYVIPMMFFGILGACHLTLLRLIHWQHQHPFVQVHNTSKS